MTRAKVLITNESSLIRRKDENWQPPWTQQGSAIGKSRLEIDDTEDIAEDERSHEDDGSPFVDCHFLSDPPSVSQMDIDDVEVFLFEVLSFDWEIIEEGFIVDIEEGTFGVFEEVADLLLLVF